MSCGVQTTDVGPPLADGLARYVELFNQQPAGDTLAAGRLAGDLGASRFRDRVAGSAAPKTFDTAIAAPGREIPVRIHIPQGADRKPAIGYFHGGGFAHGTIESFSIASEALAAESGRIVASVQYRRLPESSFSDAQDDCSFAARWLLNHAARLGAQSTKLTLAGDSVGALFAFNTALALNREESGVIGSLLLFYGAFAMRSSDTIYDNARDPLLNAQRIAAFVRLYEQCGGLAWGPAPLDRDDFSGLPPVHAVAAQHDPLAIDSQRLCTALNSAGKDASLRLAPGMIHGFLRAVDVSPAAREELRAAVAALDIITRQAALSGSGEAQ